MSKARAIAFVLPEESGVVVHAADGVSKWGISQASHPELTAEQIEGMTQAQAAEIIGGPQYWGAIRGDQLPEWLQTAMLDAAVNQGAPTAVVLLQRTLRVPVDGKLGPQTLYAASAGQEKPTLARFAAQRVMSYVRDAGWTADGEGWTERAVLAALDPFE